MIQYDLLVCIRCHAHLDFVVDTMQSVEYYTNPEHTRVVFVVDGGFKRFANKLIDAVGQDRVCVGSRRWGWGSGLWCLLVESVLHFERSCRFLHFQSIDYDTLYINHGVDRLVLDRIDSEKVGLLGNYSPTNKKWGSVYGKTKTRFEKIFGNVPSTYRPGEGVQGGFMSLSATLLERMRERGMFGPPYSIAKKYTYIADDHLLPIFTRMCGLDIVDTSSFSACRWRARRDPRGIEKNGMVVFHPTKLTPHNKTRTTDVRIRNYFRELRGCKDMLIP